MSLSHESVAYAAGTPNKVLYLNDIPAALHCCWSAGSLNKSTMILENQQIETDVVVVWRVVGGRITEVWDIPSIYTSPDQD